MSAAPKSVRGRLAAVALGLSLGWLPPFGRVAWSFARASGVEACQHCYARREVDRFGPLTLRSEPLPPAWNAPDPAPPCAAHSWVRVGCWWECGAWVYRSGLPNVAR